MNMSTLEFRAGARAHLDERGQAAFAVAPRALRSRGWSLSAPFANGLAVAVIAFSDYRQAFEAAQADGRRPEADEQVVELRAEARGWASKYNLVALDRAHLGPVDDRGFDVELAEAYGYAAPTEGC